MLNTRGTSSISVPKSTTSTPVRTTTNATPQTLRHYSRVPYYNRVNVDTRENIQLITSSTAQPSVLSVLHRSPLPQKRRMQQHQQKSKPQQNELFIVSESPSETYSFSGQSPPSVSVASGGRSSSSPCPQSSVASSESTTSSEFLTFQSTKKYGSRQQHQYNQHSFSSSSPSPSSPAAHTTTRYTDTTNSTTQTTSTPTSSPYTVPMQRLQDYFRSRTGDDVRRSRNQSDTSGPSAGTGTTTTSKSTSITTSTSTNASTSSSSYSFVVRQRRRIDSLSSGATAEEEEADGDEDEDGDGDVTQYVWCAPREERCVPPPPVTAGIGGSSESPFHHLSSTAVDASSSPSAASTRRTSQTLSMSLTSAGGGGGGRYHTYRTRTAPPSQSHSSNTTTTWRGAINSHTTSPFAVSSSSRATTVGTAPHSMSPNAHHQGLRLPPPRRTATFIDSGTADSILTSDDGSRSTYSNNHPQHNPNPDNNDVPPAPASASANNNTVSAAVGATNHNNVVVHMSNHNESHNYLGSDGHRLMVPHEQSHGKHHKEQQLEPTRKWEQQVEQPTNKKRHLDPHPHPILNNKTNNDKMMTMMISPRLLEYSDRLGKLSGVSGGQGGQQQQGSITSSATAKVPSTSPATLSRSSVDSVRKGATSASVSPPPAPLPYLINSGDDNDEDGERKEEESDMRETNANVEGENAVENISAQQTLPIPPTHGRSPIPTPTPLREFTFTKQKQEQQNRNPTPPTRIDRHRRSVSQSQSVPRGSCDVCGEVFRTNQPVTMTKMCHSTAVLELCEGCALQYPHGEGGGRCPWCVPGRAMSRSLGRGATCDNNSLNCSHHLNLSCSIPSETTNHHYHHQNGIHQHQQQHQPSPRPSLHLHQHQHQQELDAFQHPYDVWCSRTTTPLRGEVRCSRSPRTTFTRRSCGSGIGGGGGEVLTSRARVSISMTPPPMTPTTTSASHGRRSLDHRVSREDAEDGRKMSSHPQKVVDAADFSWYDGDAAETTKEKPVVSCKDRSNPMKTFVPSYVLHNVSTLMSHKGTESRRYGKVPEQQTQQKKSLVEIMKPKEQQHKKNRIMNKGGHRLYTARGAAEFLWSGSEEAVYRTPPPSARGGGGRTGGGGLLDHHRSSQMDGRRNKSPSTASQYCWKAPLNADSLTDESPLQSLAQSRLLSQSSQSLPRS